MKLNWQETAGKSSKLFLFVLGIDSSDRDHLPKVSGPELPHHTAAQTAFKCGRGFNDDSNIFWLGLLITQEK